MQRFIDGKGAERITEALIALQIIGGGIDYTIWKTDYRR